jgi:hypothetical protein
LVAQVFFRASSDAKAVSLLAAMVGGHGVEHPVPFPAGDSIARWLHHAGSLTEIAPDSRRQLVYILLGFALVLLAPNSQQIMAEAKPIPGPAPPPAPGLLRWRPSLGWSLAVGVAATVSLLSLGGTSEFLYFQF